MIVLINADISCFNELRALSFLSFLFFNLKYSLLKSGTVFQSFVYIIQIDNLDDGKACSDLGPAWPSVS